MFSVLKGLLHGFSKVVVVISFSVSWFMRPSNPAAPGMTAMTLGWIVRTLDYAISFLEWTLMIAAVRCPLFSEATRLTGREPFAALGS
jgi:hypothetical protein